MNNLYYKTKEQYNRIYEKYAENSGVIMHDAIDLFLKHVTIESVVLDIGCGPGHDVEYIINKGYSAIGIDFSENMIKYAKNNHKGIFYCLDACDKDLFVNIPKIDSVWISAMIMHLSVDDQIELLLKINDNISDNGIIGLIVPMKFIREIKKNNDILFHLYTKDNLYKLLTNANFIPMFFSKFQFNNVDWGVIIANKK